VLRIVLTVVLAVALGAASERRAPAAARRARRLALDAMLWVLVPFVAYVNIARLHLSLDAALSMAVAAAAITTAGFLAWRLGRGPLALGRASTGAAIVCTIQANTAYLGLPLCATLFAHAQLPRAVAYDAIVSLPMFLIGGYGIGALFGEHAREARLHTRLGHTLLRHPILVAVLAGLLVPRSWAPHALVGPARVAIFTLLPLGFYAVGVTLAAEAQDGVLRVPPPLTPPVAAVGTLRLLLVPAALLAASAVIAVPAPFFLQAAMPVGVNTLLVGHATGLDLRLTAAAIAWTTTIVLAAVLALTLAGVLG
jgi:predicted permease